MDQIRIDTAKAFSELLEAAKLSPGDIVVVGDCDFTFDTTSQQTISQSMAAFRKAYPHHTVIRDVRRITNGTIPDFEVVAR